MVLDFKNLVEKHKLDVSGIIHIGAHLGQEVKTYHELGTKNLVLFEPLPFIFDDLKANCKPYENDINIQYINKALANFIGDKEMYVEGRNQGQSSSLLKPQNHLKYYPDIQFTERWRVPVDMLDNIPINIENFKGINIDVQGAELLVFKGSEKILNNIEWIYTEVNTEYLYEDCALIHEVEDFLNKRGFERVETGKIHSGWTDSCFIRTRKPQIQFNSNYHVTEEIPLTKKEKYIIVPQEFKENTRLTYPPDNEIIFEAWFDNFYFNQNDGDRFYLPINFTGYHVNNNFGNNQIAVQKLQNYVDTLDKSKKYFTIIQFDDGTKIDWKDIDINIFSMSGAHENGQNIEIIPIPMICRSTKRNFTQNYSKGVIFASFVGRNTHPSRRQLLENIQNKRLPGYFTEFTTIDKHEYDFVLAKSKFALAPRGYSMTSFRIGEALRYEAIPVYISDTFWKPFNEPFDYGILCHINEIPGLNEKLKYADMDYENLLTKGRQAYQRMYTYEGLANEILKRI